MAGYNRVDISILNFDKDDMPPGSLIDKCINIYKKNKSASKRTILFIFAF